MWLRYYRDTCSDTLNLARRFFVQQSAGDRYTGALMQVNLQDKVSAKSASNRDIVSFRVRMQETGVVSLTLPVARPKCY